VSRDEGKRAAGEEKHVAEDGEPHESGRLGAKAGDILKKAITVGLGAAVLTEESIRALVGELKLPKELVTNLLAQAKETRSEFLGKFSSEMLEKIQSKIDPVELVNEVLRKNDIELSIKIKVTPKSGSEK
jgi:hypothetical protein